MRSAAPGGERPPGAGARARAAAAARSRPRERRASGSADRRRPGGWRSAPPTRVGEQPAGGEQDRARATDSSSQCASSITTSTGAVLGVRRRAGSAWRRRSEAVALDAGRERQRARAAPRPAAAGRSSRRPSAGRSSASRPANGTSASGSTPAAAQHGHARRRARRRAAAARSCRPRARPRSRGRRSCRAGPRRAVADAGELRSSPDQHGAIVRQRLMDLVNRGAASTPSGPRGRSRAPRGRRRPGSPRR